MDSVPEKLEEPSTMWLDSRNALDPNQACWLFCYLMCIFKCFIFLVELCFKLNSLFLNLLFAYSQVH